MRAARRSIEAWSVVIWLRRVDKKIYHLSFQICHLLLKRKSGGANEHDRMRYQKSRDYMVRIDDMLACKKCRRRFEIPSSQSVVFI